MNNKLYQVEIKNTTKDVTVVSVLLEASIDVLNLLQHLPFWLSLTDLDGELVTLNDIENQSYIKWYVKSIKNEYQLIFKHRHVFKELTEDQIQLIQEMI